MKDQLTNQRLKKIALDRWENEGGTIVRDAGVIDRRQWLPAGPVPGPRPGWIAAPAYPENPAADDEAPAQYL